MASTTTTNVPPSPQTPPPGPSHLGRLDRWFEITARSSSYRTEILGGATTFLTLVYIVFVNPAILSGGADLHGTKLAFDQVLAVTALAGGLLTIVMGVFGKYPFALAAGLGLNAFAFAEVVHAHQVTWSSMMGIFVIDGAVIVVLVVLGLRERIIDAIPYDLKLAIGIGIGAFIAVIGLMNAGFIVAGGSLGNIGHVGTWKMSVFVVGLLVTWTLYRNNVKGALLFGIVGATVLATVINAISGYHIWTDGTARLPQGAWLTTPNLSLADGSHFSFHFARLGVGGAIAIILAVVMSDLFDNVGTSVSVGRNAGLLDAQGRLPRIRTALAIDGLAATVGGLFSASSNTTFIESNSGVAAGARTGFASVVTGILLLLCMFISPIAGIIPEQATAAALTIVGVMMFSLVRDLRWDNASPLATFATIIVMPVTYSIANGVGVGIILHTGTELLQRRRVSPLLIIFSGFFVWYFLHGVV
ncbi:MAG TPA: NCS2 family permease [Solirubrobacteraceae bacterium]|nr:NCS2 family permease [Solirubrobacteraceae bacterium]